MTEFEGRVLADLSVLKSQMHEVLGIGLGQPGRLATIEGRMHEHERTLQRFKGFASAFGAVLTVAHFAIDLMFGKH